MIRISPSKLLAFEDFRANHAWMDYERFVDALRGRRIVNEATVRGLAVHDVIENFREYLNTQSDKTTIVEGIECVLPDFTCRKIAQYVGEVCPKATHEVWLEYEMELPRHGNVKMVMRADAIEGNILHEFKTTGVPKKWMDYNTIQVKCYQVALPEIYDVRYHVFRLNDLNEVEDIAELRYYRTRDVEEQVRRVVVEMLDYCLEDERLYKLLQDEKTT